MTLNAYECRDTTVGRLAPISLPNECVSPHMLQRGSMRMAGIYLTAHHDARVPTE